MLFEGWIKRVLEKRVDLGILNLWIFERSEKATAFIEKVNWICQFEKNLQNG